MLQCIFSYILLIFILLLNTSSSEKIICENDKTVNFLTDEIIFIESTNFPNTMLENCKMTFITNAEAVAGSGNDLRLMLVITNGNIDQMTLKLDDNEIITQAIGENSNHHFISISNNTNITMDFSTITEYNAFQGFVISDSWKFGCPLESISKINAYEFTNDTNEILYLRSTFLTDDENEMSPSKCVWNFIAPEDYMFKLSILNFPTDLNAIVSLSFGDDINQNLTFDNIQLYHPYYLETQQLRIVFHSGNTLSTNKFEGFLSTVFTNIDDSNLTDAQCEIIKDDNKNKFTWQLLDGYQNNAQCSFNLPLSIKNQFVAKIVSLTNEFNVDTLMFHYSDKDTLAFPANQTFVFQTLRNGYNKHAFWSFESDGSYTSQGFQVDFEEIECECNNPIVTVPCDMETIQTIMPNYDSLYCGNLNCSFTIGINSDCPEKYIAIKLNPPIGIFYDTFCLVSNGQVLLESKDNINESDRFITTLLPSNTNVLQLISHPALYEKHFSYTVLAVDPPTNFQNISLTHNESSYILDIAGMDENSFIYVELDDDLIADNDTFEVYSNFDDALNFITFFDEPKFENVLLSHKFFDTTYGNSVKYIPAHNYLYVYKRHIFEEESNGNAIIFFRALNAHTKNCIFKENIYDSLNVAQSEKVVSMLAAKNGSCEIILLNRPGIVNANSNLSPLHQIKHFWTTSEKENVKIFRGGQFGELLFGFNKSTTITELNQLVLLSGFYTIVVPSSKSVAINLNVLAVDTVVLTYPYKALWSTPYYGSPTTENTIFYKFFSFKVSQNAFAQIKIKNFNVSSNGRIEFVDSKLNSVTVTHVDQLLNFTDTSVKINYFEKNAGYFGVLMKVETYNAL